ncbi:hypothetical protein AC578_6056 [Pseudocercospora eumusae]|uniref:Uncharacterized protein n=1 Tax=Pseudocercospora eumusae TaxID=321146 RepID=A0A139HVX6_9PEZI|nr:hypothetical protein AC578_6056 [Pseudocercospora eumusae]
MYPENRAATAGPAMVAIAKKDMAILRRNGAQTFLMANGTVTRTEHPKNPANHRTYGDTRFRTKTLAEVGKWTAVICDAETSAVEAKATQKAMRLKTKVDSYFLPLDQSAAFPTSQA